MKTEPDTFLDLLKTTRKALRNENGAVGNLEVVGRHVKLKPEGQAVIVSDIHGDLESLVEILKQSDIIERMKQEVTTHLFFLGDYGDRGGFSAEVYYTILKLKLQHPTQVILMRGNHEGPEDLLASPHDLPTQYETKFGKRWHEVYDENTALFPCLYVSTSVEKKYLMVHGGLPAKARKIEDFAHAHETHPKTSFLEEILWSDPAEGINGVYPSPRGAGRLFGKDITQKVLDSLGLDAVIRGHEPCSEGFQINHDGKILTLFSRKGEPYYNDHGAYLDIRLSDEYSTANQLASNVKRI